MWSPGGFSAGGLMDSDTGGLMRRIRSWCASGGGRGGLADCGGRAEHADGRRKADGWKLLFDGKTTTGWRGWKQQSAPEGWKAVDGALTRVAKAGDLITVEQYASFDFAFDWRIAKNGNSGVFFHVAEGAGPAEHLHHRARVPADRQRRPPRRQERARPARRRQLRAPSAGQRRAPKPIGEWNQSRILVNGPHVEHWLNGVKVVDYELWSADWKDRVAKSKFKAMPRYGLEKTGHIALQDHGDEVAFRNLKIKVLDKPGS